MNLRLMVSGRKKIHLTKLYTWAEAKKPQPNLTQAGVGLVIFVKILKWKTMYSPAPICCVFHNLNNIVPSWPYFCFSKVRFWDDIISLII